MGRAILTTLAKDRTKRYADVPSFIEAVSTKKTAQQWYNEGVAFFGQQKNEEAFKAALRLNPNDADAYVNKGTAFGNLGRFEEALQAYLVALRLNPNDADAYYGKGNVLARLERYQEALQAFEEALRLNPNYAYAYQGKGLHLESWDGKPRLNRLDKKQKNLDTRDSMLSSLVSNYSFSQPKMSLR